MAPVDGAVTRPSPTAINTMEGEDRAEVRAVTPEGRGDEETGAHPAKPTSPIWRAPLRPYRSPTLPPTPSRDRLVLAGKIVAERPQRDIRLGRDVLDGDVLQAPLDGQPQCGRTQRLPDRKLLA